MADDTVKRLEARITELESKLSGQRAAPVDISAEEMATYHKVNDSLGGVAAGCVVCNPGCISECTPCVVKCIKACVVSHCISKCIQPVCINECICGPCIQTCIQGGGTGGTFGGFGQ